MAVRKRKGSALRLRKYNRLVRSVSLLGFIWIVSTCAVSLSKVDQADLQGIDFAELQRLQFYSGENVLVFLADTEEQVREVKRDALVTRVIFNQLTIAIPAGTPGILTRYDRYTGELYISYDAGLPPFRYRDVGAGLELISTRIVLDQISYERERLFEGDPGGLTSPYEKHFLFTEKETRNKEKKTRRKAAGLKVGS